MTPALAIGLGAALLYAIAAAVVIAADRRSRAGGWISLHGLASGLVTLPVSLLAERAGRRLDHRSNLDMALAVAGTGLVVALVAALAAWPFVG